MPLFPSFTGRSRCHLLIGLSLTYSGKAGHGEGDGAGDEEFAEVGEVEEQVRSPDSEHTFVNPPAVASVGQARAINALGEPPGTDEIRAVGDVSPAGPVKAPRRAAPAHPSHPVLVGILSAFLVVALVAVGFLAWRSTILSNEVRKLYVALVSTTTTRSTTTTADPWGGNRRAYQLRVSEFLSERSALLEKDSKVPGTQAKTHAKAIRGDIVALALMLNTFPRSPNEVQAAQDDYFDALMKLASAADVVQVNDSWSNVDVYNKAWNEEFRLLNVWLREIERAK